MGVLVLGAAIVAAAMYFMMRAHRWLAAQWFLVRLWRWFTGHTWHGEPITDAGWLRPGRRVLIKVGHASRWHHLPRLHRAAWRTGGTLTVAAVVVGLLAAPAVTLALLGAAFLAGMTVACGYVIRMIANRRHRRTWLHPLHLAAHELAGHPRAIPAKSWITAEVDADGAVNKATLELPPGFPADEKDKQRLVSIASQKLGIEAAEPAWRLAGPTPLLTLRHSPPPPGHVTMAYLLPELASCKDDELLIGVGKNDEVIKASLGTDSPHIAISMGTGAGKSNLAGWILLQMLLRDGIGLVLDAKRRLSYPWILKDGERRVVQLPDVAYAWTTAQMHEAMAWLSGELDRRGDVAFAAMDTRGRVHANVGNRLFILAEELNLAVPRLRAYWQENRDPEIDPSKSPAFTGLGEVAFAGRQVRKHLILVGQMLTAEATGSRDSSVKENCGIKLLARYGPKGWRMMAEDIPMPPPPAQIGRVQLVTAGQAREVQTPELDPVEARRLVLDGNPALLPPGMPCRPAAATVSAAPALEGPSDLGPETISVSPPPGPLTLRDAVRAGILHPSTTIASLRMARHRDPAFPARKGVDGRDYLYDAAELAAYDAARRT